MKKIDQAGLILCDLQAKTFEQSLSELSCSTEIFIRRFMNSKIARNLDSEYAMGTVMTPLCILKEIEEEYGTTSYGSVKYTANEIYWIGYIYRYFSYTYEMTSAQAYKIIKPKELRPLYPGYHTMDCAQAIERFLEAKGIAFDDDIGRQYQVFKMIRKACTTEST